MFVENFWTLMNINLICHKYLKRTFKTGFWVQNYQCNLCSSGVNSQRLLCSQKLVWNVRIKVFWYTKYFFILLRSRISEYKWKEGFPWYFQEYKSIEMDYLALNNLKLAHWNWLTNVKKMSNRRQAFCVR